MRHLILFSLIALVTGCPRQRQSPSARADAAAQITLPGGGGPGAAAGEQPIRKHRWRGQQLTDEKLAALLAKLPPSKGLISLDLEDNHLTHASVSALARAPIGHAEVLLLSANPIGDAGARAIAAGRDRFFGVRVLHLAETKITAAGVTALTGDASVLSWVDELELSDNPIGDEGVEAITRSRLAKSLSSLYLKQVGLTDRGALALARCPHLQRLRYLSLAGNRLTPTGRTALSQSPGLAKCTINFGDPPRDSGSRAGADGPEGAAAGRGGRASPAGAGR